MVYVRSTWRLLAESRMLLPHGDVEQHADALLEEQAMPRTFGIDTVTPSLCMLYQVGPRALGDPCQDDAF